MRADQTQMNSVSPVQPKTSWLGLAVMPLMFTTVIASASAGRDALADEAKPNSAQQNQKTYTTVPVRSSNEGNRLTVDGVVEAVKTAEIAPQVAGLVQQILVQAGDPIKQGQVLARIDARAVQQELAASRANIEAVKANLLLAEKDYERQKALFDKNYISQAQLDRAAAVLKSTTAQAQAQIAQASAVQTQSSFYTLNAPFDGYVAAMPSAPGQMAMPGKPVMTVYDPRQLRVIINVPQARLAMLKSDPELKIEFPSLPAAERFLKPKAMTVVPVSDATSHTVQVRFDLDNAPKSIVPGLFARVSLELMSKAEQGAQSASPARLFVPRTAVMRRAEMFAVYVVNAQGKAVLRQVKPGPVQGAEQEILSGLNAGEAVVRDALSLFAAQ